MDAGGARGAPIVEGFTDLVEIGSGGFSIVYAANQTALRRRVALKVLSATGGEVRRVEREAAALGALSDIANVVQIFQVTSTADGRPVLVTELMESSIPVGIGLDGNGLDRALRWLGQVAAALDEAHRRGIFHRDIKPQNVLMSSDGAANLVDFGIAGLDGLDPGTTTAFSFSPPFAPPERLEGTETDLRAGDVYALAATFFAVLTGTPPFGSAETGGVHGLITRVVTTPLPCPDGMDPKLHEAFARAMAKNPSERFSTASDFAAAFAAATRRDREAPPPAAAPLPVTAGAPGRAATDSPPATAAAGSMDDPQTVPDRVTSVNRRGALAAAVALMVLAGAITIAWTQRGGSMPDEIGNGATSSSAPSTTATTTTSPTTTTVPPPPTSSLTSCSLTGTATLTPGVPFAVELPQTVTLPAEVKCPTTDGELAGTTDFTVSFPLLGFNGGSGQGTGTIFWADGSTTDVSIEAGVTAAPFGLSLRLDASSGPAAGLIGFSMSTLSVDIMQGESLTSILVQGDINWYSSSDTPDGAPGSATAGGIVLD